MKRTLSFRPLTGIVPVHVPESVQSSHCGYLSGSPDRALSGTCDPCRAAVPYSLDVLKGGEFMQDINNKLKEILEKLTDFFENFVDEMAEVKTNEATAISHLQTIEQKQDTMIELLRTIAANTAK